MKLHVASLVALFSASACAATTTNPGSGAHLSAAQQDVAARVDERDAARDRARFDPSATALKERCNRGLPSQRGDGLGECWYSRVNPTDGDLVEARLDEREAAQHRAASQALRDAEARACAGLDATDRDVSPFAHRSDIVSVTEQARGATVVFRAVPTMNAAGLQRIIDCHIARNDALGHDVPWMPYCPLVPRDVTATVTDAPAGLSVRIETPSHEAASEVKARATALMTPR